MSGKVPRRPPDTLHRNTGDVLTVRPQLARVARTTGAHTLAWNALRHYGPLASMRWDPHPEPPAPHAEHAVGYAGTTIITAIAEVYQLGHVVDLHLGRPYLTLWTPRRDLHLLDLTGNWPIRNGAAHALFAAPKAVCRAWARAIADRWPRLDGLWAPSTMTGEATVVLFPPAATSFPAAPDLSRSLSDPAVRQVVSRSAARIGYRVVG